MSYGRYPYGGVGYAGADVGESSSTDTDPSLAVEISFTTGPYETPVWIDVTPDVRSWDVDRGRNRELERFQPGRATVVFSNADRDYDSQHATGPWFGNLKPNKRVRIRETFNGTTFPLFDGYVDRWHLDYPLTGKDATATLTATDGFKLLARTDLPRSVYVDEVAADAPEFWWRLDEPGTTLGALNHGSVGTAGDGTYVGAVYPGSDRLVVNDPGTSIRQENSDVTTGVPVSGVDIPSSQINFLSRLENGQAVTVEFWCRPREETTFSTALYQEASTPSTSGFQLYWFAGGTNSGRFALTIHTDTLNTPEDSAPPGSIYHVVYRFTPSGSDTLAEIFINGSLSASGTLNDALNTGTIITSGIGHTQNTAANWTGQLSQFAVYLSALADARISAHYQAGVAPWDGDTPSERIDRGLDEAGWSEDLRSLDAGGFTCQSATLGTKVLEHLQKVAESEFGLLFMSAGGSVRFVGSAALLARDPDPAVFGDASGEIGYRSIKFDEADSTIRNYAAISRLDGVLKTSTDSASVDDFGRFDYRLDGLLHDDDDYSQTYADFIVDAYAGLQRRVSSLTLGPAAPGKEAVLYPQMAGRELGDAVTVKHTPPGGGDRFEQTCAIEAISHSGAPGKRRQTVWKLSPEFASDLLLESGDALLLESGDNILLEG